MQQLVCLSHPDNVGLEVSEYKHVCTTPTNERASTVTSFLPSATRLITHPWEGGHTNDTHIHTAMLPPQVHQHHHICVASVCICVTLTVQHRNRGSGHRRVPRQTLRCSRPLLPTLPTWTVSETVVGAAASVAPAAVALAPSVVALATSVALVSVSTMTTCREGCRETKRGREWRHTQPSISGEGYQVRCQVG